MQTPTDRAWQRNAARAMARVQARQPMLPSASALQVRRAYEAHHGRPMPEDMTYHAAAMGLVDALGQAEAVRFIQGQSNDPSVPL